MSEQLLIDFPVPEDDHVEIIMSRLPKSDSISPPDIASAMDIHVSTVYAWIDTEQLPVIRYGAGSQRNHYKISRSTFRRFLEIRNEAPIGAQYTERIGF